MSIQSIVWIDFRVSFSVRPLVMRSVCPARGFRRRVRLECTECVRYVIDSCSVAE